MPDLHAFLSIEKSYSTRVKKKWKEISRPATRRMAKALADMDFGKAEKELYRIDTSRMYKGEIKYLRYVTTMALLFGASNANPLEKTEVYKSRTLQGEPLALVRDRALHQFELMLVDMKKTLVKSMRTVFEKYEKFRAISAEYGVIKKVELTDLPADYFDLFEGLFPEDIIIGEITAEELVNLLAGVIWGDLLKVGDDVIDIAASLQSSRLASYGFLTEAIMKGAGTYVISEQLDSRTCPVCEQMHGQTFEVAPAVSKLDGILRVDDPQALMYLAPWPKQDKESIETLKGMSAEELVDAGYDTPPYHPRCRGMLTFEEGF